MVLGIVWAIQARYSPSNHCLLGPSSPSDASAPVGQQGGRLVAPRWGSRAPNLWERVVVVDHLSVQTVWDQCLFIPSLHYHEPKRAT